MRDFLLIILILTFTSVSFGQQMSGDINRSGLSFVPDHTFKGSVLTGWKSLGNADWSAKDGEITGTVKAGAQGLLVSAHSFQDVAINTFFNPATGSEAGLICRLEKTNEGMKGVMVSVKDGESGVYKISFDSNGKELSRERLRAAGGMIRLAPPAKPDAVPVSNSSASRNRPQQRPAGPADLPIPRPSTALQPGDWNHLEIILDMNILRSFINDGSGPGGAADDENGSYGPIALFAAGDGKVSFKDLKYKDLAIRNTPVEKTSPRFEIQQLSDMYYSWSSASADFNKDGFTDIVAGPHIYYGPAYTKSAEIFMSNAYSPSKEFTEVNCQYTFDFNNDGWPDVFSAPPFGNLYINPKGESRRWSKYSVIPGNINSEITVFRDIDGDNRPELIYGTSGAGGGLIKYAKPDPADPAKPWKSYTISEPGYFMAHGIGVGDINGDGRLDILNPNGWWEQPATLTDAVWAYHPEPFARYGHRGGGAGGSVMAVYDVNGDKLNDVVTSLNAHGFGLAWYEQKRDGNGRISFVRHMIMDDFSTKNAGDVTFSELHGSTFADVDGDGVTDFIVGKRYFSHIDTHLDPDPYGEPVLYWYRTVRNPRVPGGAEFVPELIHNRSGAGSDVLAEDLNKDGAIDIVTSTNRGTFIFWNKSKAGVSKKNKRRSDR